MQPSRESGAWYTYGEERLGQGREAAKELLRHKAGLGSDGHVADFAFDVRAGNQRRDAVDDDGRDNQE